MQFTGLNHVCVVTHDLDRAVSTWSERYGIGPWELWTKDASNMTAEVAGRPTDFAMRVALCTIGRGVRVELIQPLDDRSPYAESLARHDGADHLHHIRLDVEGYDDARRDLLELGLHTVLDATFAGDVGVTSRVRATYLSTEAELGFLLEIADVPAGFAMPPPERIHPKGAQQ
jgi:methylmalonyl-CoA/ethylmalonyl-CoA epimerase